jgi:hypothetical protein
MNITMPRTIKNIPANEKPQKVRVEGGAIPS